MCYLYSHILFLQTILQMISEYGAQFQDQSVLLIPLTSKMDQPSSDLEQDHLEFGFSTGHPSGVLFYIRNEEGNDVEEKLIIMLINGDLEAHIDLGAGLSKLICYVIRQNISNETPLNPEMNTLLVF